MIRFTRWLGCGLVLAAGLQLLACSASASPGKLEVDSAWLRATVPGAASGAGYAVLRNTGGSTLSVVAVESPAADSTMIHTMDASGGMTKMRHLDALDLHAGESIKLEPGGTHLMLMGLKQPLVAGQSAGVSFVLKDGQKVEVRMPVRDSP